MLPPRTVVEARACENEILVPRCPAGHMVRLVSASYGRTSDSTCPGAAGACSGTNAMPYVLPRCALGQPCDQYVQNTRLGGDPCPGVSKELVVRYQCFQGKQQCGQRAAVYVPLISSLTGEPHLRRGMEWCAATGPLMQLQPHPSRCMQCMSWLLGTHSRYTLQGHSCWQATAHGHK